MPTASWIVSPTRIRPKALPNRSGQIGSHAACTRRVSAAQLAPTLGKVVKQFQLNSSRTDSPVRVLPPQPRSPSPTRHIWKRSRLVAARRPDFGSGTGGRAQDGAAAGPSRTREDNRPSQRCCSSRKLLLLLPAGPTQARRPGPTSWNVILRVSRVRGSRPHCRAKRRFAAPHLVPAGEAVFSGGRRGLERKSLSQVSAMA